MKSDELKQIAELLRGFGYSEEAIVEKTLSMCERMPSPEAGWKKISMDEYKKSICKE